LRKKKKKKKKKKTRDRGMPRACTIKEFCCVPGVGREVTENGCVCGKDTA
jgi:hypothetical protein